MSFFNKLKRKCESDIKFVGSVVKSKDISELKNNIKEQHKKDKEFVKNITGVDVDKIQQKISNDIVFVKKVATSTSIDEVKSNIQEQHDEDKKFVKDMTGINIDVKEQLKMKMLDMIEYEKLKRTIIFLMILLYIFDTKLFVILLITYFVYCYDLVKIFLEKFE